MVPEWISWTTPLISGAVGVYVGLKVGIVRLETNYATIRSMVDKANSKLEKQVGEDRCDRYRGDCQNRIEKALDRIEQQIESNREYVGRKFSEIAVYMAKHNGD